MKNFVSLAFVALLLAGFSSAQSVPAVDVFGGYSFLNLEIPSSSSTQSSQSFKLNGWDGSASIGLFHHFSAEADFSGHQISDCGGTGLKCDDFSYLFGPRYTFGDRSSKVTIFVHGLVGRDRADIIVNGVSVGQPTLSDTATAVAAGAGLDYWFMRHIGVQLGPVDFFYTNHLQSEGAASQETYRAAAGVVFRFGGNFPPSEPKAPKEPKQPQEKSETHRSWTRPWKRVPNSNAPQTQTTTASPAPSPKSRPVPPVATTAGVPSRGMPIHVLGITAAPQEFDGAKVLGIEPGSVAEMASLHVGDLIKSVDGKIVRTPMELAAELADKTGKVRIGIQRGTFATETVILLGVH